VVARRALAMAAVALAGCHDYDIFRMVPDGFAGADLVLYDFSGSDLTGCPSLGPRPTIGPGCTFYSFEQGLPSGLQLISPPASSATYVCNRMVVAVPAGASHDLWIDNIMALRLEEKMTRSDGFVATTRIKTHLASDQQLVGLYAVDPSMSQFVTVETSFDNTSSVEDHVEVFTNPNTTWEMDDVTAAMANPTDLYEFLLARGSGTELDGFTASTSATANNPSSFAVADAAPMNVGVVFGNCCNGNTPSMSAEIDWLMICPN
jgi:hypothetical protein